MSYVPNMATLFGLYLKIRRRPIMLDNGMAAMLLQLSALSTVP